MNENKKGFVSIGLVVLIVVIVGIAVYFALIKKDEPVAQQTNTQSSADVQTSKSQISSATNTSNNQDSSDKTYITPNNLAKESGEIFKFQYPVGFTVIEGGYKTPGGGRFPDLSISKNDGAKIDVVRIPGGVSGGMEITCKNYSTETDKCIEVKGHVVMTGSKDRLVLNVFDLIIKTLEIENF